MPSFVYEHRETKKTIMITARSLNRAREQLNKKEWRLVRCYDERGLCWEAKDVGLDF